MMATNAQSLGVIHFDECLPPFPPAASLPFPQPTGSCARSRRFCSCNPVSAFVCSAKRSDFGANRSRSSTLLAPCAAAFARKPCEPIVVRAQLRQLIGLNTRRFVQLPESRLRLVLN